MAELTMHDVWKVYPDGTEAVRDLDLEVRDGEFMVLVGPSGCGKSTALRMVAGLEDVTDGELRIGDRLVNDESPKDRDVAMVFQDYALYPHMTIEQNMAFALKLRKLPRDRVRRQVRETAATLGLEDLMGKKPKELSGGQRQRAAMGRALVREPQLFLLDEPLSNLDAKLRVEMRAEIADLQRDLGVTTLYVTHDQVEAMTMADRVAVMRQGVLQQVDEPQALYRRPANLFVAGFIGSPAMNLVLARLTPDHDGLMVRFDDHAVRLDPRIVDDHPVLRDWVDRDVIMGIRPENLEDATIARSGDPTIRVHVEMRESLGSSILLHLLVAASATLDEDIKESAARWSRVRDAGGRATLLASVDPESRAEPGDDVELSVDVRHLHWFDPQTGVAIAGPPLRAQGAEASPEAGTPPT